MGQEKRAELDADFTAFVEANARRIRSLAEWLSGDPERAADLAQAALERTYVRWAQIRSQDPMVYVRKALLNQQRDWWRRRQHRPEWPAAVLPDRPGPDDHATGQAQRDVIQTALAQLTRRERHVVVLRYYADLADPDIAAEVGIAVGTVKSTAARALRKLRGLLGPGDLAAPVGPATNREAANVPVIGSAAASASAASASTASASPAKAPAAARPSRHRPAAHLATANLRPSTTGRGGEA